MPERAVGLRNVAAARGARARPPGATMGRAIGPPSAPSQPPAIATAGLGTAVPGGVPVRGRRWVGGLGAGGTGGGAWGGAAAGAHRAHEDLCVRPANGGGAWERGR